MFFGGGGVISTGVNKNEIRNTLHFCYFSFKAKIPCYKLAWDKITIFVITFMNYIGIYCWQFLHIVASYLHVYVKKSDEHDIHIYMHIKQFLLLVPNNYFSFFFPGHYYLILAELVG